MSKVKIENGEIEGEVRESGTRVFKGIPFAKPPVGPLRFKRPVKPDNWEGVKDCKQFQKIPPQKYYPGFYEKEFFAEGKPDQSEDCLYLNVWAPPLNPDKKYPVMFWIHGGAYEAGYCTEKEFDGESLNKKECILVTTTYRLNVFGFLTHPILESDGQKSGNQAIYELILALEWVQNNIEAFGGDKNNVTVYGQSAGAMATQILLTSPLSQNLFHKAIMQSGGGFMYMPQLRRTREDLIKASEKFLSTLNIKTYEELMNTSTEKISQAYQNFKMFELIPHIDGEAIISIHEENYDQKRSKNCPVIIGCLNGEFGFGSWRVLYHMGLNLAKKHLENNFKPVYIYKGVFSPPGDDKPGCFHSADLWYTFGTLERCWRPFDEKDKKLSELFVSYWTNFAKTGDPNGEGLPEWTPYTAESKKHLKIDYESTNMESAHWF